MAIAKQYKQLPAKLLAEATIDETQSPHDGILPVIYSGRYKSKRVALRLLSMENSLPQADMAFHFWVGFLYHQQIEVIANGNRRECSGVSA